MYPNLQLVENGSIFTVRVGMWFCSIPTKLGIKCILNRFCRPLRHTAHTTFCLNRKKNAVEPTFSMYYWKYTPKLYIHFHCILSSSELWLSQNGIRTHHFQFSNNIFPTFMYVIPTHRIIYTELCLCFCFAVIVYNHNQHNIVYF